MGDQKSGNTVSATNSTNTSGPNPFIADKLQSIIGGANGAWNWIGNNMNAPAYFPNGTVAPRSQSELDAATTARGWASSGLNSLSSTFAPALGYLSDAASGKYLDLKNNPYFQGAIDYAQQPVIKAFKEQILPGIGSMFTGSGRTPQEGNASAKVVTSASDDLTRNLAGAATQAGSQAYGQERGLQSNAATAIPGAYGQFANTAQSWLGMLNNLGLADSAYGQRALEGQNAKYSYDTTGQLDWYTRLTQALQGMYPGGQTTGSSTSYGTGSPAGGGTGSILGPAMSAVGMALPFVPGFGLSDRRDKTDITELGVDPLTGMKTYAYRYKGDPKDTPKIVGPMAQDIEKVRPDLVREIGGHKVVDMRALQPTGGLL